MQGGDNIIHHFTYKNYIQCIHKIKQKDYLDLREESEKYHISTENNSEKRYKAIIEYLFKDKQRICFFLNCFLDCYERIEKEKLVYIDFYKGKKGIKIIYKHSDKQIFYMIIYQQEVTINLPYFILQECIKIMQNYKRKDIKNMIIIPIVIYVKENKYKYGKTMKKCFQITTYDNHILELKYNLMNLSRFLKQPKMRNTILEELIYIEN